MNTTFIAKTAFQPAPAILACLTLASVAFAHGGYSHDSEQKTSNEFWMTYMHDSVKLSEMSIPGTHDTMAYGSHGPSTTTQSMDLKTQLKSGVRMLDIRCRNFHNTFEIHHGPVWLGMQFDDVLDTVKNFLITHPRESVLMRVKEEYTPYNTTSSFEDRFSLFFNDYRYSHYFWKRLNSPNPSNPQLGEIRGKIVVLQNFSEFSDNAGAFGISWRPADLDIQDEYNVVTIFNLADKWGHVKRQLNAASYGDRGKIYINFLSGSGGVFPFMVAEYTNVRTSDFLSPNMQNRRRVGIIVADFPGPELIDRIIKQNTMYTTESTLRKGQLPSSGGGITQCLPRPQANTVLARNGWQELVWQSDGNLVVYDAKGPRWATGTNSPNTSHLCWQSDGNLVIYAQNNALFATGTHGKGEKLMFQKDCNLVIYDAAKRGIWMPMGPSPWPCTR